MSTLNQTTIIETLQLQNPIGFGPGDFMELGLAAFLVLLAILWPRLRIWTPPQAGLRILIYLGIAAFVYLCGSAVFSPNPQSRRVAAPQPVPAAAPPAPVPEPPPQKDIIPGLRLEQVR